MKARLIFSLLLTIAGLMAVGQRPTIELTFTAINNTTHAQLDSIKVMNKTQACDTVLYWPDTILSIYFMGINEHAQQASSFKVFQNYPNPVIDQTIISLYVPGRDKVSMIVTDTLGRIILESDRMLEKGNHSFRFVPGNGGLYFFTARWRGNSSSIKILHVPLSSCETASLDYIGIENTAPQLKVFNARDYFAFSAGDWLLCIGYSNGFQSGMLDLPETSETYTFQFATNIPCPGTPTVEYEGQVYNTIQIFSQCWLKENLNIGTMIQGIDTMTENGILEKYCYNNEPDSCIKYGGLYQWNEMMQYTIQEGAQGICPSGWHIPTDEEWKVLEGAADSQFGIGDHEWDYLDLRGYDAGTNLKTTSGWRLGGNGTDQFGFSCLPGGHIYTNGSFGSIDIAGDFWSSTPELGRNNLAWTYMLWGSLPGVKRFKGVWEMGFSIRCLRDN